MAERIINSYCSQERFPDVPGVTAHTIEIPCSEHKQEVTRIYQDSWSINCLFLLLISTDVVSPQHSLPSSLHCCHCCHSLRAVSGEKFFPATSRKCKPGRSPAVIRSWSGSLDFAVFTFASKFELDPWNDRLILLWNLYWHCQRLKSWENANESFAMISHRDVVRALIACEFGRHKCMALWVTDSTSCKKRSVKKNKKHSTIQQGFCS